MIVPSTKVLLHGTILNASVLLLKACVTPKSGRSQISLIFMIMAVPFLYATGIYNPPVVHHGRCIAEPGTFNALYCMGRTEAPQNYRAR